MWVLSRNRKAPNASCKSRRAQREGRARGQGGSSTLPCLASALSPPGFSVFSTPPWHTGTLLSKPSFQETSLTTQALPTAQPAHRDLPGCAMKQSQERRRRRRREGGCTARAGNLSTPPSHLSKQKPSPTLQPLGAPCSRLAGWASCGLQGT